VFGAGSGHANITRLRARNQGRKISVDFWLVVDPAVAAGRGLHSSTSQLNLSLI
jgi:hypothetical protein